MSVSTRNSLGTTLGSADMSEATRRNEGSSAKQELHARGPDLVDLDITTKASPNTLDRASSRSESKRRSSDQSHADAPNGEKLHRLVQAESVGGRGAVGKEELREGAALAEVGRTRSLRVVAQDGPEAAVDAAQTTCEPDGNALKAIARRVVDAMRTVIGTVLGIFGDAIRLPFEAAGSFFGRIGSSIKHLLKGEFAEFAKDLGMAFVDGLSRAVGGCLDMVFRAFANVASVIGTLFGFESVGQPLPDNEKRVLGQVYGDSVNLDAVRVKKGGLASVGAARTVGNTIYLPDFYFDRNGNLTAEGSRVLHHEMGHVWQNQRGGGDYMHKSVYAQAVAAISTGSRGSAYEWRSEVASKTAFRDLNPEQQASAIGEISMLIREGKPIRQGTALSDGHVLSRAEADYLNGLLQQVRSGEGAP